MNVRLRHLFESGVSLNQAARKTRLNRKTVVIKQLYLGKKAELRQKKYLKKEFGNTPATDIQFDDLETSVITKLMPVSVPLAVCSKTRKVLAFSAAQMPARGDQKPISEAKYGVRKDERGKAWEALMEQMKPFVAPDATIRSDSNPNYPKYVEKHFPNAVHAPIKGMRGRRTTGQGELKEGSHDPLFPVNHTFAMFRAHVSRLFRRSWNLSKRIDRLMAHLWIYVDYHNRERTGGSARPEG